MILIPTSGSFLIAFLIIAIYVFIKNHKEKAESGYYTQEAKDRRTKLQEQKYAQKRRKMKKDVAYNYIKTYKLHRARHRACARPARQDTRTIQAIL